MNNTRDNYNNNSSTDKVHAKRYAQNDMVVMRYYNNGWVILYYFDRTTEIENGNVTSLTIF